MEGTVAIVPSLKAPGFINAGANAQYPDVSSCTGIELDVRSTSNPDPYTGYRFAFGNDRSACGQFFARGYHASFSAPSGAFDKVQIPFSEFTRCWSDSTGEAIKTCAEDPSVCPTTSRLQSLQTLTVWAEGKAGDIKLDIKSINAYGCGSLASTSADEKVLYDFTDPKDENPVNFYVVNDPVMGGGASTGSFEKKADDVGFGRLSGTVALIPYLQAPGFIKAITCTHELPRYGICAGEKAFADASGYDAFTIRARSSTPDYTGFKFAFGPYKQDFTATSEWSEIVLPFNQFSSSWSAATGEPTKLCKDDPSVCPTDDALSGIKEFALWAEGVAGQPSLDVQWIKATRSSVVMV